jgi:histidinol phosphatase-like PHP family hydrolase
MIDLHLHTFLSDGDLCPAELVRRVEVKGFRAMCFADHVDNATVDVTVPMLVKAARELSEAMPLKVLAGCEVTHCRPEHIARIVTRARELGADLVVVHGESPVEPVIPGTNRAAIESGADILAHPGLLSLEDAREAAKRGVALEISARGGHSLSNGHVALTARAAKAQIIFGSDSHSPEDICDRATAERVLRGAGLSAEEIVQAFRHAEHLAGLRV